MQTQPDDNAKRAASLARLQLGEDDVQELAADFHAILEAFERLAARRFSQESTQQSPEDLPVAPHEPGTATSPLREDRPTPSLDSEVLLSNAPARSADFFAVPKTIQP